MSGVITTKKTNSNTTVIQTIKNNMRENKGTYQDKDTFASCKASAKDLQTVPIPLHQVVLSLYLVATVYNLLRSFFNFPATTDNLSFSLPLYKVCVNYLHQCYSNISTMEKTLSADTMGIYKRGDWSYYSIRPYRHDLRPNYSSV